MKTKLKYVCATIMLAVVTSVLLNAQTTPQVTSSPQASAKKSLKQYLHGQLVPYHGIISAVDKNAKTFTIEGRRQSRVLKIIEGTSITKGQQPASIDDINNNDEVSGAYFKDSDGTLVARSIKIGPIKRRATPTPTASPIP